MLAVCIQMEHDTTNVQKQNYASSFELRTWDISSLNMLVHELTQDHIRRNQSILLTNGTY